jgi:hypothetical protein
MKTENSSAIGNEIIGKISYVSTKGTIGWICPLCNCGISPWAIICPCQGPKIEETTTTTEEANAGEWRWYVYPPDKTGEVGNGK